MITRNVGQVSRPPRPPGPTENCPMAKVRAHPLGCCPFSSHPLILQPRGRCATLSLKNCRLSQCRSLPRWSLFERKWRSARWRPWPKCRSGSESRTQPSPTCFTFRKPCGRKTFVSCTSSTSLALADPRCRSRRRVPGGCFDLRDSDLAAPSLFARWMALVPCHSASGHRSDPGRPAIDGGPLCLCSHAGPVDRIRVGAGKIRRVFPCLTEKFLGESAPDGHRTSCSPSPLPSPSGRGNKLARTSASQSCSACRSPADFAPSPQGRGPG